MAAYGGGSRCTLSAGEQLICQPHLQLLFMTHRQLLDYEYQASIFPCILYQNRLVESQDMDGDLACS